MSTNSAWDLGLSIGESFAELSAFKTDGADAAYRSRWYLPRKSLADGLKEALRALETEHGATGGRLHVVTDAVARILEKRQGRAPAVLVSAGFETWHETQQPLVSAPFTARAERATLPTDAGLVFTVGGRIAADGTELAPLPVEDLEAIAAKLALVKVKDIALNFLHAARNPEHERQAASFLRDRGFRVFASHGLNTDHAEAWRAAIECAFAESAVIEEREQIETALKDTAWTADIVTPSGSESIGRLSSVNSREGVKPILKARAKTPTLHCGLDLFCLFGTEHEALLAVRVTSLIRHGAWSFPTLDLKLSTGFAPGPMALGKSQKLTLFDILFVRERLQPIDGLTPLLSEKTRSRILETLFTLAKPASQNGVRVRPPDANEIAADLERAFVERCAIDLCAAGIEKKLNLSGPLAETMKPLFAARRPDLKITTSTELNWVESHAVAGRGPEAQA